MKRFVLAIVFSVAAFPAAAQQIDPQSSAQAYQLMAHQAIEREARATAELIGANAKIETLTKERDALKAATPAQEQPK